MEASWQIEQRRTREFVLVLVVRLPNAHRRQNRIVILLVSTGDSGRWGRVARFCLMRTFHRKQAA